MIQCIFHQIRRQLVRHGGSKANSFYFRICRELLQRETEKQNRDELRYMENPKGNHALHEACDENHVKEEQKIKVIKVLFEGVNMAEVYLDHMNNEGCTPLMLASRSGYADIARWLISNGADIFKSDMDDWVRNYVIFRSMYL